MADVPTALREQQFALARHVRDPAHNPAPAGIDERRLRVYRDLFYNSIESLLAGNFPVLRRTLGDPRWHALVRDFYADFRCHTPLFTEIGREFVRFAEEREQPLVDPPWLHQLAHYEWVELALQLADAAMPAHRSDGDLLAGTPVVSPLAWALAYDWPVHRIGPDYQPDTVPDAPTLLLVRRDAAGEVHFSELSPLAYRLLALLAQDKDVSGYDVLQQLAAEAGAADVAAFLDDAASMLHRLHGDHVVLGIRPV